MDPAWPAKRSWKVIKTEQWDEPLCEGTLELGEIDKIKLIDAPAPTEKMKRYRVRDFWPQFQIFLVEAFYYESHQQILLNLRDGKEYQLFCGRPIFSNSGSLLVSACLSLNSEGPASGLSIWQLDRQGPLKQYSYEEGSWGAKDIQWNSDDELSFSLITPDIEKKDIFHIARNSVLAKGEKGWELKKGTDKLVANRKITIRLYGCGPDDDADLVSDRELFIKVFENRVKEFKIPVIYDNQSLACDILFENAEEFKVLNAASFHDRNSLSWRKRSGART